MAVLLVVYEVADEQKRSKIVDELKKRHRTVQRLAESAYALQTEVLPVRVFDQVERYLDADDQLYVFPAKKPYTGYGPRRITEWLSAYLPTREDES